MDQAEVLKDFDFPTVMLLPHERSRTSSGSRAVFVSSAIAMASQSCFTSNTIVGCLLRSLKSLVDDGLVSWIKYAVVRDQPMEDAYLREVLQVVPSDIVVSGIGEQPAIIHMRDFGIVSYTSGCVCVAPKQSMEMLQAIHDKDWDRAESIRMRFFGLEDLRLRSIPFECCIVPLNLQGLHPLGPCNQCSVN